MQFHRWQRFGHDRLYIKDDSGAQIGWWDLRSSTAHDVAPEHLAQLTAAARAWQLEHPSGGRSGSAPLGPVPPPVPVVDIAHTLPGRQLFDHASAEGAGSSWDKGIVGENVTANHLFSARQRDPRWSFLNSVSVGEATDIDHVLIGPGGVFTINTKHHREANVWVGGDTVMVSGHRHPYVRCARSEARKAERLLSNACNVDVSVTPLVVIVGFGKVQIKQQPDGVIVMHYSHLTRFVLERREVLSPEAVAWITDTARRSDTWIRPLPRRSRR